MDALFSVFNSWSTCMFCGGTVDNSNIKFCNICCKNILGINDQLLRIRFVFDNKPKVSVLSTRLGIKCRKDFKEWSKHNHPDKGGNPDIYIKVSQLVDRNFPKI